MFQSLRHPLLALALLIPASAQNTVPPRPDGQGLVPAPISPDDQPSDPTPAATPPPAQPRVAPKAAPAQGQPIDINLPKVSGNEIAEFYHQLTGKRVLVEAAAAPTEASIVVHGKGASPEDAIKAFEKALLLNNLAIVPSGPDEVKLIVVGGNRNVRVEGVPVIGDATEIPDDDSVVTYVMPLQYIKPEEAQRTFTQSFATLHNYGSITPVPNAAALIVTENASLIKKMISLLERIDQPSAQIGNRWITCKYADVETLAETLDKIVNQQNEAKTTAAQSRQTQPAQINSAAPLKTLDAGSAAGEATPVQIVPDPRTNRILIVGRPIDLVFIESLVAGFDIPTDNRNSLRRKLRYLSVVDFLPVAQQALERISGPDAKGQANQNNRQQNNSNNRSSNQNNQNNRNNQNSSGSSSRTTADVLADPDTNGAPESLIVGRTLLVADTITNSIVVQGPPQSIEAIGKLLDEVDVRGPQVMISTVFGQFRREEGKDVGVDWISTYQKDGDFGWAGQVRKPDIGTDNAAISDLNDISKFPSVAGMALYGTFGKHMNAIVKAAQNTGKFSVLSRPTVYTVNNAKAVISSGQRIAVPTSTYTDFNNNTNAAQSTNIEYKDVVLKLEVIPLVNSDKEVTLKVAQLNDQVVGSQTIGNLTVPTLSTQELITQVTVPNGGTVILGGLITRDVSDQEKGVPILSDIPLIGWAFSTTSKKVEEREIVIFIQPTIINQDQDALNAQIRERSRYAITPEVIPFADPNASMVEEALPPNPASPTGKPASKSRTPRNSKPATSPPNPMNNMKRAGSPF